MRHKITVIGFLALFGMMLLISSFVAYSRRSGNTGLDMAKIHQLRAQAQSEELITQK